MIQLNCSSPESLYVTVNASWCPKEEECLSAEDLVDLCLSRSAYLEKYLGPCRSRLFLPVCITYLLIFVVGVLGNSLTCIVIARHPVMRTTTNFYLFSLAISDLLVLLLGLPYELYELWSNYPFVFGVAGCYFKTYLFETVCFASVLNVTALSAERYRAVTHPLHAKHVATHAHAKRLIIALWVVSLVCALPNTSLHGVVRLQPYFGLTFPESAVCTLVRDTWIYNLLVQVTAVLFFILPMLTISVLYVLIGLQLHRERECFDLKTGMNHDGLRQRKRHRQVNKMLCALVIVFGICWVPFHTDRVMWSYIKNWTVEQHRVYEYVHLLSGVFFYLGSVVNPILYNLMSSRFREMFREVVCQKDHRQLSISKVTLRSVVSASLSASHSVSFSVKFNARGLPQSL
ncbi:neuromedin-U receptor 1-like [Myxocyprinus asiaticus]|uniref:neuromedin-U receptor 1-like n=1 Tax=Myxocyprinus asiaticus TaxID=70543 RepID=UPI0022216EF9|nr:neuromedin-U receptor 1-like [Myxocyprinus asiaticus]